MQSYFWVKTFHIVFVVAWMAAAIVAVESGEEAINHRTLSMAC